MEEEINLKDIFITLYKHKIPIIVVTVICLIVSLVIFGIKKDDSKTVEILNQAEEIYVASNTLKLGYQVKTCEYTAEEVDASGNIHEVKKEQVYANSVSMSDAVIETLSEVVKTKDFLDKIVSDLELDIEGSSLSSLISVERIDKSDLFTLSVNYSNSETALEIANKATEVLQEKVKDIYDIEDIKIVDSTKIVEEGGAEIVTGKVTYLKYSVIPILGFIIMCVIVIFIDMIKGSQKKLKN